MPEVAGSGRLVAFQLSLSLTDWPVPELVAAGGLLVSPVPGS